MPKGYPIQTNFTSGELTPSASVRVDTSKYFNGAGKIENWFVLPQGGLTKRPGTQHIVETKDSSKLSIQRRFEFSTIQAYVLEIGDLYFRILKDQGQIQVASVPVEVVTPYLEAELRELKFAQSADVLYVAHKNHPPQEITRTSDIAWTITDYVNTDGPYLDTDESDVELRLTSIVNSGTLTSTSSDFVVGDIGKLVEFKYLGVVQLGSITAYTSATEVTITPLSNVIDTKSIDPSTILTYVAASGGLPDRVQSTKLIWSVSTENSYVKVGATWYLCSDHIAAFEEIAEVPGPPKELAYSVDLQEVASTPAVVSTSGVLIFTNQTITGTLTSSSAIFENPRDVGRLVRLNFSGSQIPCKITAFGTTSIVTVSLDTPVPLDPLDPAAFIDDARTVSWRLGAWYLGNYPAVVNFHEGRINFYSSDLEPLDHWASVSASKTNFAPTDKDSQVLDSSGITRELNSASDTINNILWAISGPVLLLGSQGAEWAIKPSTINQVLTPSNYNAKVQTEWGSESISPERIGHSVIYVQKGGKTLRELIYQFEIDSYKSFNLSYLSDHIFSDHGGIVDIAYQKSPFTRLYCATGDGQLVCCTFEKDQEVIAFYRLIIGGSFGSGDAAVESVEAVPTATGDIIQLQVKRTIDGATKRYLEYITVDFAPDNDTDKDDMFFLDSALRYTGVATNIISGLDHSEGETVTVVADGSIRPTEVVTGGSITFEGQAATNVLVGYNIVSDVETLNLEAGSVNGTAQGKQKAILQLTLRVLDSIGFRHGPSEDKLSKVISFRRGDDVMDSSPPFFTGDKRVDFKGGFETDGKIYIRHDQPYPCTILAVIPQVETTI